MWRGAKGEIGILRYWDIFLRSVLGLNRIFSLGAWTWCLERLLR